MLVIKIKLILDTLSWQMFFSISAPYTKCNIHKSFRSAYIAAKLGLSYQKLHLVRSAWFQFHFMAEFIALRNLEIPKKANRVCEKCFLNFLIHFIKSSLRSYFIIQ